MAPNRGRNRQHEFDDHVAATADDFDPEEEPIVKDSDDDASDLEDENEFDGREHYEDVGKSKLRKPKSVPLGPQYRGSKVDRQDLESEDEDDPFSRGFESESSEDEGADMNGVGSDEEDVDGSQDEEDESGDETDDTDLSDSEGEYVARPPKQPNPQKVDNLSRQIKEVQAAEKAHKSVTGLLSQANKDEAEKGRAVKRQRTTFDALLNTRMKLQKSLIATNTLVGTPQDQLDAEKVEANKALKAAETAAFNLWSNLNKFREDLLASQVGKKRKRVSISQDTATADLWEHFQAQEAESKSARQTVLKKWSQKASGPSMQSHTLNQSARQGGILEALEEQLGNADRLLKKAHAPRSCAPLQLSQRVSEDSKIYDDADFYGLLLKELLEQKSADSVAASNIDLGFQMRREVKTKRDVDTKASKGRKLRYTVHEKLQNFMAPEDRTKWGERQADELFGSLFGQRLALAERDEEDQEMEAQIDPEEALLMFRS